MAAASECDLEGFLKFVLQKTEELSLSKDGGSFSENFLSELLTHVDLLGKTTQLLHEIGDSSDDDDNKRWNDLENVYTEIEKDFISLFIEYHHKCTRTTTTCDLPLSKEITKGAGRPAYSIPKDVLVELRGLNFSWNKIAQMFGVSRWTIMRRVEDYGLIHLQQFSAISDERIDDIIQDYMSRHGHTTGEPFMSGYLRSLGLHIQRRRVRAANNRVDPRNTALRWGALVRRKTYFVPWANSLWHLDGHHSLIGGSLWYMVAVTVNQGRLCFCIVVLTTSQEQCWVCSRVPLRIIWGFGLLESESTMVLKMSWCAMRWFFVGGMVVVVSLQDHPQGISALKGSGEMCIDVCVTFFITFFMLWSKPEYWILIILFIWLHYTLCLQTE